MIHVVIGTKAQYIKTAPLLRRMDAQGVPYRLVDTGQHAELAVGLRTDLGVRDPDHVVGGSRDVNTIPQAIAWSAGLATSLVSATRLREDLFAGLGGVCVVHGDTPSTLLSTLMAKRAGLDVAHLEAGLRSDNLLHPFPEEAIRVVVMHLADVLFAPDATAVANLKQMEVRGEVVALPANTSVEALRHALKDAPPSGSGPAIVTMHRVENLNRPGRVRAFVDLACRAAAERPVVLVGHGPTRETLARMGLDTVLADAGVRLVKLLPHDAFVAALHAAPFVVTDGGSIQEECALMGVPTLLWRRHTERPDGLGDNVVLSAYDPDVVAEFLADPDRWRRPFGAPEVSPSAVILATLVERYGTSRSEGS